MFIKNLAYKINQFSGKMVILSSGYWKGEDENNMKRLKINILIRCIVNYCGIQSCEIMTSEKKLTNKKNNL
jgi:hypothetical protein